MRRQNLHPAGYKVIIDHVLADDLEVRPMIHTIAMEEVTTLISVLPFPHD